MKAFIVDRYAKNAPLRLGEIPEPEVRENDVLVQIHAASINLLDSKIRDGEFKPILPYRPPFVLGHDVAGTVIRVGGKVRQFKPGDEELIDNITTFLNHLRTVKPAAAKGTYIRSITISATMSPGIRILA